MLVEFFRQAFNEYMRVGKCLYCIVFCSQKALMPYFFRICV